MAENTLQLEWIIKLIAGFEEVLASNPDVFVAGDNLIYPVEGQPKIRMAPDVYVAFGRPKGHRSSYLVWNEGNIFPQVVVEVLSPGNRTAEMKKKKKAFYAKYGAEEYYVIDSDDQTLEIWLRHGKRLKQVAFSGTFTSPRLGVVFEKVGNELVLIKPNGKRFETVLATNIRANQLEVLAEQEYARAEEEKARADQLANENAKLKALLLKFQQNPDLGE